MTLQDETRSPLKVQTKLASPQWVSFDTGAISNFSSASDLRVELKLSVRRRSPPDEHWQCSQYFPVCVAVPFTPSQGIMTPSPGNMAHRYYQQYSMHGGHAVMQPYSNAHYMVAAGGGLHLSPMAEAGKHIRFQPSWTAVSSSPSHLLQQWTTI